MKKYKLLKDMPGFKAGYIVEYPISSLTITADSMSYYPEWFEEIKEPSDEEILARWLEQVALSSYKHPFYPDMAKALIQRGFNVASLKECEHEWANSLEYPSGGARNIIVCCKCGVKK